MNGRLNIPQRTVLMWDDMHPYNAIHVVRIPQPLDPAKLKDSIDKHLKSKGLTGLVIDRKKKRYNFKGGAADIHIKVIEGGNDVISALRSEIQEQLNTPFNIDGGIINPIRFFAVREEGSFYLGLVYYHVISGGDSIIYLLKGITRYYMGGDTTYLSQPLALYQAGNVWRKLLSPGFLSGWLWNLPGHVADVRKCFRPKYKDYNDHSNGFAYFSIEHRQFQPMLSRAKEWGVTVNDIFIAVLLKSIEPFAERRRFESRRTKLSVVSVINIRRDLSVNDREGFGMYLGTFNVSHTMPDGIEIKALAEDVHGQTEKIKKHKLYLGAIMEQWFALFLLGSILKKQRSKLYSKNYPLWGGISNINLNAIWDQPDDKIRVDYFRAVSTGPATPIVFSLTTVKGTLNIGVSFRKTVFSETDVEKIISDFTEYTSNLKPENADIINEEIR
ncbi:MAG: hypothetical protein HZC48_13785 [Nitrospirae bacterium]|nr:hypothetical protein [Nitrospirota bacterium]